MKLLPHRWRRQNDTKQSSPGHSEDEKRSADESDSDKFNALDLTDSQRQIVKVQAFTDDDTAKPQGLLAIYRYATRLELFIVAVSIVSSIGSGIPIPLMIVIFGQFFGNISSEGVSAGSAASQTSGFIPGGNRTDLILYLIYLAIAELVLTFIATAGWQHTGRRLARKVRERYLAVLLRQNVGFFDTFGTGKVTSHITSDMNAIQEANSEKVGLTIRTLATVIASFVVAFVQYWALALILSSSLFAIMLIGSAIGLPMKKYSDRAADTASKASIVAEETFAAIKTVSALNMQQRLTERYRAPVMLASTASSGSKAMLGLILAAAMGIVNLMYGLAFWQGNRFAQSGSSIDLSGILITLLAVITGSFTLASIAPNFQAFVAGSTAAASVFKVIDRVSPIDVSAEGGQDASQMKGEIEFRNLHLVYPSRPDIAALRGFDLSVPAGKTTALVGPSGSGKTSVVGLLERFYSAIEGSITIDGTDISQYNLPSLRRQISLVSQEPTLFGYSIYENIAFGLPEAEVAAVSKAELDERVKSAARKAHAEGFITSLAKGYESVIGDVGVSLSGGQRQRVAIARAIISNPRILLLDEATSALDTDSENEVQAALMEMARDRTTISIAHRLSTVRDADSIAVVSDGRVHEQGTHHELLEQNGIYKRLVDAQSVGGDRMDPLAGNRGADGSTEDDLKMTRTATTQSAKSRETGKDGTADLEAGPEGDSKSKPSVWKLIRFGYRMNLPERWLLLLGCVLSVISGAVQPATAVLFAKSILALATPPGYGRGVNFWAAMYLMMAFVAFFSLAGRGAAFGKCSAALSRRLRLNLFAFILSRETAWFDRSENSAGMLSSLLSTEPENVAGVSGATLGALVDGAVTLFGGCILALVLGWKLALVCISLVPVLMVSGFLNVVMIGRFQEQAKKVFEESASFASELIAGIRTVASFSREDYVWGLYHQQLYDAEKKGLRWVLVSSFWYAASQAVQYLIFALVFWYGGKLVSSGEYGPEQFFIVLTAVIFGAQSAAQFFGFAPDMSKARVAATRILQLVASEEDFYRDDFSETVNRSRHAKEGFEAHEISFKKVTFQYEGLVGSPVLDRVSFEVKPGSSIALVGPSGSGKSTAISLITRNYHPNSGHVSVNGADLATIHRSIIRDQISLVSQDPILFSGSIRENLLLGLQPNVQDAQEEQMINACKDAYIWDFVASLPEGLDTVIGSKGVTLSGGQRQRITIARALLRSPKILLLDEATSALDSESEGMVQAALKRAAEGRTTIAVAHRLSTIRESDCIYVLDKGSIVQYGTHAQLIAKGGLYRTFVEEQNVSK